MWRPRRSSLFAFFFLWIATAALARDKSEALFYYVPSDDGWASLSANPDKIRLLGPQVFILDEFGKINGALEERVRALAAQHDIKLMPLLANEKPEAAHNLLVKHELWQAVIADALRLCQEMSCVGLQLDIEGVLPADGDSFVKFVREAHQAFHKKHLQFSIALPTPLLTPSPGEKYAEWFGGFVVYHEPYEFEQIVPYVDFISLMTYGQYGAGTAPGPVAGYPWVEQSIRYALQAVPRKKLSLGLGFWAYRWCGKQVTYSGYADVEQLRTKNNAVAQWQEPTLSPWFEYQDGSCRTVAWYESRRSLLEKLKLVHQYKLRGFSAWRLGQEDPEFWKDVVGR